MVWCPSLTIDVARTEVPREKAGSLELRMGFICLQWPFVPTREVSGSSPIRDVEAQALRC